MRPAYGKGEKTMVENKSFGERLFTIFNTAFLIFLMLITLYPFLFVFFGSISDPLLFIQHKGILLKPEGFTLEAYKKVLTNPMIAIGYYNVLYYVVIGTALNVLMTSTFAYALSRKGAYWNKHIMKAVVFTMYVSGGMIPGYILVSSLGMLDTRWALIIPGLISTWNLIIMRTNFQQIPESLEESAKIDGAGEFTILFKIIIPLSIPIISVMVLFYGVAHWNSWANALMYIKNKNLYPLQLVLREILILNSVNDMMEGSQDAREFAMIEIIKYAAVIVATVPILVLYPFIQKYFTKGVMVGAIKG
jgi:ABC-type sugar transport system, permease component